DRELVLAQPGEGLPPRVKVAPLRQRDQLLDLGFDDLGLRLGRLDALVFHDLLAQVHDQRLAMAGVSRELVPLLLMAHRRLPTRGSVPEAEAPDPKGLLHLFDALTAEV